MVVVASLALAAVSPGGSLAAEPLAIVSAVQGKVAVTPVRAKESKPAAFGLALQRGDRVAAGRASSATLFFNDGNVVELGEQSSIVVGAKAEKPAKAEIAGDVFLQVSGFVTAGARQTGLGIASAMRGGETATVLVRPRKTSVLDPRPTFAWRRVSGAARYTIRVSSDAGPLWNRETPDTSLAYPPGVTALAPDSDVLWEVEARSESGRLRNESTVFHVLAPAVGEEIRKQIELIDTGLGNSVAAHYLAGTYLSAAGLYDDAIDRFRALCLAAPDSPGPHEALGRAYASVGLMDLAATEYERALELSRAP
jgi:Tfp pilus assembly protein PilZ